MRYTQDTGEFILDGVSTSVWNHWTIKSFQSCDIDDVCIEIGILTYPNEDAMSKRVFYRYSHGKNLPNEWTSICN